MNLLGNTYIIQKDIITQHTARLFYSHHWFFPFVDAASWAGQGWVWAELVPWGQLISSPALCILYLGLWIATTYSYCFTAIARKAFEILEVWKWLIYQNKSHFPLSRKACVLPFDFEWVCICVYFLHMGACFFVSVSLNSLNWWNRPCGIITLLHCVLAATPQHCHDDPERALHHACQNVIGSS